uniref:Uncharacterized protein n=1 Tax=Arundo donax TaxID=35708 RepID=A0A0A9HQI5_ARUDO
MLYRDGVIDEGVSHIIEAGWMKWHQESSILYDKVAHKL